MIQYLDPSLILEKKQTETPPNRSRSGYGSKLPTSWMLKLKANDPRFPSTRWHRVYVIQYSNAGSSYIIQDGKKLFLGSYDPHYS